MDVLALGHHSRLYTKLEPSWLLRTSRIRLFHFHRINSPETALAEQLRPGNAGLRVCSTFGRFPTMTCYIAAAMLKYKVGDHLLVKLSGGRIVEATIQAIIETTDGVRLQMSFGEETALI